MGCHHPGNSPSLFHTGIFIACGSCFYYLTVTLIFKENNHIPLYLTVTFIFFAYPFFA